MKIPEKLHHVFVTYLMRPTTPDMPLEKLANWFYFEAQFYETLKICLSEQFTKTAISSILLLRFQWKTTQKVHNWSFYNIHYWYIFLNLFLLYNLQSNKNKIRKFEKNIIFSKQMHKYWSCSKFNQNPHYNQSIG